jgi:hypothetical protein
MTGNIIDLDERLFEYLLSFDWRDRWTDEQAGAEMDRLLCRMRELTHEQAQLVYAWFGVAEDEGSYEKLDNLRTASA